MFLVLLPTNTFILFDFQIIWIWGYVRKIILQMRWVLYIKPLHVCNGVYTKLDFYIFVCLTNGYLRSKKRFLRPSVLPSVRSSKTLRVCIVCVICNYNSLQSALFNYTYWGCALQYWAYLTYFRYNSMEQNFLSSVALEGSIGNVKNLPMNFLFNVY